MSTDADLRAAVESRLAALEREHGVRVLYAAESCSRAWGFLSPDSDFDVRFVYAHPSDWCLSVLERSDVIETLLDNLGLDVSRWDLRKAVRLLLKSNPALSEWLVSPIVYRDEGDLAPHSIAGSLWREEFAKALPPRKVSLEDIDTLFRRHVMAGRSSQTGDRG